MNSNTTQTDTDMEIVRRVVNGDTEAFGKLIERYKHHVLTIVKRHAPYDRVEELTQEVFVGAFQSLPKFKKAGSFKSWLSAIAVRRCYDFWRKQYRSMEVSMSTLDRDHGQWLEQAIADQSDNAWQDYGRRHEARQVLDWALAKLGPEDRIVLELVYLEGLSVKEAAQQLGWSVANVKVRSFRSRKKLHQLLLKEGWK